MLARHVARKLALFTLYQRDGRPDAAPLPTQEGSQPALEDDALMLASVRMLVEWSRRQVEEAGHSLADVINLLDEAEMNDPANLESPLDAPTQPVALPNTRQLREKLAQCLSGAETLMEAMDLPESLKLARQQDVRTFAHALVVAVEANREAIDTKIAEASPTWKPDRLVRLDRAVLRLAVAELFYLPADVEKIDTAVTINEAVELAKQYSTAESYKFINGVLGALANAPAPAAG